MTQARRVKATHRREVSDELLFRSGGLVPVRQHIDIVRIKRTGEPARGTARIVRTEYLAQ